MLFRVCVIIRSRLEADNFGVGGDYVSDTLIDIITIFFKVGCIGIAAHIIMYMWCFVWIYIQANTLAVTTAQCLTEDNYITAENFSSLKDMMSDIYDRGNFNSTSKNNPIMGIYYVTIKATHTDGTTSTLTIRPTTVASSVTQKRYQSGCFYEVGVTFNYPTMRFLIYTLAQGDTFVQKLDDNGVPVYQEETLGAATIGAIEKKTSGRGVIKKYTMGMKYYPDLEGEGYATLMF